MPPNLRSRIVSELHSSHAGSSRMKELARSCLWWPNLEKDLEELCNSCPDCLSHRANPPKAKFHPWEWPTRPWHRIHVDYAGPVGGHCFLIIVDAHSNWVDIYYSKGLKTLLLVRLSIACDIHLHNLDCLFLLSQITDPVLPHRSLRILFSPVVSGI